MAVGLWPDFEVQKQAPAMKQLLQDAVAGLSERTGGKLDCVVRVDGTEFGFVFSVVVLVAATGHQFTLFRVQTGIQPFPAKLTGAVHPSLLEIANSEEFQTKIAGVLNSQLTRETITNILANLG